MAVLTACSNGPTLTGATQGFATLSGTRQTWPVGRSRQYYQLLHGRAGTCICFPHPLHWSSPTLFTTLLMAGCAISLYTAAHMCCYVAGMVSIPTEIQPCMFFFFFWQLKPSHIFVIADIVDLWVSPDSPLDAGGRGLIVSCASMLSELVKSGPLWFPCPQGIAFFLFGILGSSYPCGTL